MASCIGGDNMDDDYNPVFHERVKTITTKVVVREAKYNLFKWIEQNKASVLSEDMRSYLEDFMMKYDIPVLQTEEYLEYFMRFFIANYGKHLFEFNKYNHQYSGNKEKKYRSPKKQLYYNMLQFFESKSHDK